MTPILSWFAQTSIRRRRAREHQLQRQSRAPGDTNVTIANATILVDGPDNPPPVGALVREGTRVRLRKHIPANRPAFQDWYADEEIARLLRHDQRPLNDVQSRGYFDTIILPMSAAGTCYAIHEAATDRFIGSTALTDFIGHDHPSALFRIVIGEKDCWDKGYGTESTRLVVEEAFKTHNCSEVRLEVFQHNQRAIAAYRKVGFRITGEHVELVGWDRTKLHVIEMSLRHEEYETSPTPLVQ
jgi:RimJ/RimL family protein N-acetyltransferase